MLELMWAVKAHRHAETYQRVFAYLCSYFSLLLYFVVSVTTSVVFLLNGLWHVLCSFLLYHTVATFSFVYWNFRLAVSKANTLGLVGPFYDWMSYCCPTSIIEAFADFTSSIEN